MKEKIKNTILRTMHKNVIKSSYISFIGLILMIITQLILAHKTFSFYNFNMRKVYALITYLVYVPLLGIVFLTTAFVFYYYCKNKFKPSLKYFYFTIPSILYLSICAFILFQIIYKVNRAMSTQ